MQVHPQHHQAHAEKGGQQPGAGRPLRPGRLQQSAAKPGGRRRGGRQGQGQQVEGGTEFIETGAQLRPLAQQCRQLLAFAIVEVAEGMAGQQGIDGGGGRLVGMAHGSLR